MADKVWLYKECESQLFEADAAQEAIADGWCDTPNGMSENAVGNGGGTDPEVSDKIADLENDNKILKEENSNQAEQIKGLSDDVETLSNELADVQGTNDELETANSDLTKQLNAANKKITSLEKKLKAATAE